MALLKCHVKYSLCALQQYAIFNVNWCTIAIIIRSAPSMYATPFPWYSTELNEVLFYLMNEKPQPRTTPGSPQWPRVKFPGCEGIEWFDWTHENGLFSEGI